MKRRFSTITNSFMFTIIICISACGPRILVVNDTATILKKTDSIDGSFEIIVHGLSPESACELKKKLKIIPNDADCSKEWENVEKCDCTDDLEKWRINSSFKIETAIGEVRKKAGADREGDTLVNLNILLELPKIDSLKFGEVKGDFAQISPKNNDDVIVAVVDTGINTQIFKSDEATFLNTENIDTICNPRNETFNAKTGWNFAGNNADSRDNHGHGNFVTLNIIKNVKASKETYKILPLKVFDDEGYGSYWNTVCAFAYINKLRNRGYDIAVVNASFGLSLDKIDSKENFSILKKYIDSLSNSSVVVTSAGNKKLNNDLTHHFPSSFSSEALFGDRLSKNVASVAGIDSLIYKEKPTVRLNQSSNYGRWSVNIATPWSYQFNLDGNLIFEKKQQKNEESYEAIILKGTSYSAAFFSSQILTSIIENQSSPKGAQLLNRYIELSPYDNELKQKIKEGKYMR